MRDAIVRTEQWIADHQSIKVPEQRPYITDVFFGLTTETPTFSDDVRYSDARYYIKRAVAPADPSKATYARDGTATDEVNVQISLMNGAGVQSGQITATNLHELPSGYLSGVQFYAKDKFGNGQGTHTLTEGTLCLVFGLADALKVQNKWYVFVPASPSAIPTGQYQNQVLQMVAQNQTGWDFIRGHSLI